MSGPAGFEYPPQEVSWNRRDVLLFASSIGCSADEIHFLYELDPNFQTFPTYPVVLALTKHGFAGQKGTSSDTTDFTANSKKIPIPGAPPLDSNRVLDGSRRMTFLKPLPTTSEGRKFEARTKVVGVYDKGKAGTVVETEQSIVDAVTGEVYTKANGNAFYVGQGNWGGPKGPATVNYPPPKDRAPDAVCEFGASHEIALLYRLNGDYNPLHADAVLGAKRGFGGIINHGLYSWNCSAHGILKTLGGNDPKNLKEFQARFAAPVKPGYKLSVLMWKTGKTEQGCEEVIFVVKNQEGLVVLSNGRALVKIVGPKSKI
ncbi:hypothetical protein FQN57_000024 [Myotisia sp. PD_48]|nr:hypothetical protein FQN57_000024 [Myotisia sp. PD_48]